MKINMILFYLFFKEKIYIHPFILYVIIFMNLTSNYFFFWLKFSIILLFVVAVLYDILLEI